VNTATGYLEEVFTATNDLYVSFRLRIDGLPAGSPRLMFLSNAGTTYGNLVLTSTGRLRLRDFGVTIGADSAPLTVGTVYQVTIHQRAGTGGNGLLEAWVAPVGTTTATAPFARLTTGAWTTGADRLRIGATNSTAVNVTLDDIQLAANGRPADLTTTAAAGGGAGMTLTSTEAVIERDRFASRVATRRTGISYM
jgi:hypothetical protein